MKFNAFQKVITTYKKAVDYIDKLYSLNIDLYESPIVESNDAMFEEWLNATFELDAQELIYWWLFEDVDKSIVDKDGNKVTLETLENLYEYIVNNEWILN